MRLKINESKSEVNEVMEAIKGNLESQWGKDDVSFTYKKSGEGKYATSITIKGDTQYNDPWVVKLETEYSIDGEEFESGEFKCSVEGSCDLPGSFFEELGYIFENSIEFPSSGELGDLE